MKLAILADIHANLVALQAVIEHLEAWEAETVVVAGDIVNRGPRPAECLQLVQEKARTAGWHIVRGNHEDYVIKQAQPAAPRRGAAFEVHRPSYWTYQQLGFDVTALEAMPFQVSLPAPDGSEVRVVHASMRSNRDGIYPFTSDEDLAKLVDPACPVLGVGHTHCALIRRLNGSLVVNAGSVGLPFDLDTRPGYAQLTWRKDHWQAEIIRIPYDLHAAHKDLFNSGYVQGAGPLIRLVEVELLQARGLLYNWAVEYQQPALDGQITMEAAVERFLQNL